jgi:hypothetical protein
MKLNVLFSTLACAAALGAASTASATVYDFTFVGSTYDITDGTFTTASTLNSDGTYNIVSASGDLTSSDSSLPQGAFTLVPGNGVSIPTTDGAEDYSNLYTPGAASFADNGLELAGAGGLEINIYNGPNAGFGGCASDCLSVPQAGGSLYNPGDAGGVSITAVPEPATWAMMFLGFGGLGVAMRSQRRKLALAA